MERRRAWLRIRELLRPTALGILLAACSVIVGSPVQGEWSIEAIPADPFQLNTGVDGHTYAPSGNAAVAYGDDTSGWQHYAERGESGWVIESFGTGGYGGFNASLEFDDEGNPSVAFGWTASLDRGVRFAHRDSAGWDWCNVWWGLTGTRGCLAYSPSGEAAIGGHVWQDQRIICKSTPQTDCMDLCGRNIEDGRGMGIVFLYSEEIFGAYIRDGELRAGVVPGGSGVSLPTIDTSASGSTHVVLSPTGAPFIAYGSETDGGQIRLASLAESEWEIEVISSESGSSISLAFDPRGLPSISYVTGSAVKFCYLLGADWQVEQVDCCSVTHASLAYHPSGNPSIVYCAGSGLYYALRDNLCPGFDYGPTPTDGDTLVVLQGETIFFVIQASDPNPGDVVDLTAVGLPSGATFDVTPGQTTVGEVEWATTIADVGDHAVFFVASDSAPECSDTTSVVLSVVSSSACARLVTAPIGPYYGAGYGQYAIASAGRFNGDSFDDFVVGAYAYGEGEPTGDGRVYFYFGGYEPDSTADLVVDASVPGSNLGISAAPAGDFNDDGFDDVIVGADEGTNGGPGLAYVYFGSLSPDTASYLELSQQGIPDGSRFGTAVGGAGDFNDDECADVVVGAKSTDGTWSGAYVFFGSSDVDELGTDSTADVVLSPGVVPASYFGRSVAFAGDVNNDGADDILVGAKDVSGGPGQVFVFLGGTSPDGIADIVLRGEEEQDDFGGSMAGVGSVNEDDYDDIFIGAGTTMGQRVGKVYLYFGGASLDTSNYVVFSGNYVGDSFGNDVSSAGDLDHDGNNDLIVGAPAHLHADSTGRAYIYLGGAVLDTIPDCVLYAQAGDNFGYSVALAGDVDFDLTDEVLIGTNLGASNTGQTYVYSLTSLPSLTVDGFRQPVHRTAFLPNFPNPFSRATRIVLSLPAGSDAAITIHDITGRLIRTLVQGPSERKNHSFAWDGRDDAGREVPAGVYLTRVETVEGVKTGRVVLAR